MSGPPLNRGNADMYHNAVLAEQQGRSISAFFGRRQQREFIKAYQQGKPHPYLNSVSNGELK